MHLKTKVRKRLTRQAMRKRIKGLMARLRRETAISAGRRRTLMEKADELRSEWQRAERAEGRVAELEKERDAYRAAIELLVPFVGRRSTAHETASAAARMLWEQEKSKGEGDVG
jgi:hypothetical protein